MNVAYDDIKAFNDVQSIIEFADMLWEPASEPAHRFIHANTTREQREGWWRFMVARVEQ